MTVIGEGARIQLKNILYLTDFSEPSKAAVPFAAALARTYGASVHALHVLTPVIPSTCPEAVQADEELATAEMVKVDSGTHRCYPRCGNNPGCSSVAGHRTGDHRWTH